MLPDKHSKLTCLTTFSSRPAWQIAKCSIAFQTVNLAIGSLASNANGSIESNTKPHDLNNFDGLGSDGGVYASARDLYRWHQVLLTGKLLPHSVCRRATTSGTLADGSKTGYGYGWFLRSETVVDHAGGWVGFSSYIYRDLATGNVLVILDNSTNALRVVPQGFRFTSIGLNLIEFVEDLPR